MGTRYPGRNMWLAAGMQSAKGTPAYRYTYLQPDEVEGFFAEYPEIESNKRIGTRFKGSGYVGLPQVPFSFSVEFNPGNCGVLLRAACGAEVGAISGDGYTHTFSTAEDLPYLTFLLYAAGVADTSGTAKIFRIIDAKIKVSFSGEMDDKMMLKVEGIGISVAPIPDIATAFTADTTDTDATLTDISITEGVYPGMPIGGTGIPAGTVIASFESGLTGAMALANSLKTIIVAHINDYGAGAEEHIDALDPAGATLNAISAATDLATLLTLTNGLTTCYVAHDGDVDEAVPTYHQAQSTLNNLTAVTDVTTLHLAIDRLNDIKAKYNLHDADATSHEDGSTHQEATANADTTAEMSAVATATNPDVVVTVSNFSTAASSGFTSDTPFFVKSALCVGKVSIGATIGSVVQFDECRSLEIIVESGLEADNRIDNTSTPTAIEEGESEITGNLNCLYNKETLAEVGYFQASTARALKIELVTTNVFDTDNYKTLTININQSKYTEGKPAWDPDVMNVELPLRVDVNQGFTIVLFDNTGTEYDATGTAIT